MGQGIGMIKIFFFNFVVKVTLGADQSGCYTEVAPLHSNFQYIRFYLGDFSFDLTYIIADSGKVSPTPLLFRLN